MAKPFLIWEPRHPPAEHRKSVEGCLDYFEQLRSDAPDPFSEKLFREKCMEMQRELFILDYPDRPYSRKITTGRIVLCDEDEAMIQLKFG